MTVDYIRYAHSNVDHYEYGYNQCSEDFFKWIHSSPHLYSKEEHYLIHRWKQMSHHQRLYRRRMIQYQRLERFRLFHSKKSRDELWRPYI